MVKIINFLALLLVTYSVYSQNLSIGVGTRANANFVDYRTEFNFDVKSNTNDTLKLKTVPNTNAVKLITGLSFPIYARYTSKRNWYVQLNYGYEIWRLGISGYSTPTEYAISNAIEDRINELPVGSDSEDIRDAIRDDVIEKGTTELESFERAQFNKLSFAFGSSFNKRGLVTFYYGAGFDFYTASTFESYQGLIFENDEVSFLHQISEALPKLESNIISPFINFGIEKQNIRFGFDLAFYPGPVFGEHEETNEKTINNGFDSQLVKNIASAGVSLNYTLFNQNFNQAISTDKKNVLDPLVIGRYRQKPKFIQFGGAINFPNFHNSGWSVINGFEISNLKDVELDDSLISKKDNYLSGALFKANIREENKDIFDFIYLEKVDDELVFDENNNLDTSLLATTVFFDLGNINSIVKSPKLSGFVRINPHELFSADLNIGYQNHTYGITAYETVSETIGGETNIQTRKLVYQENFHEISLGLNAYIQKHINNISQLGFHAGINYNVWLNGKFSVEEGGINDSELLQDFHDYNIGQKEGKNDPNFEEAQEWKGDKGIDNFEEADKGVFTKVDYYNYNYENKTGAENYYTDYSPYLLNSIVSRSYFELRFGIDYYIENLKFNLYAERSLLRNNTMYNSLFTVGMGVALFLN